MADVVVTISSTQAPPANWDGSFNLKFYSDQTYLTESNLSNCPFNYPHASADGASCCHNGECSGDIFPCQNVPCSDHDSGTGGIFIGDELFVRSQWTLTGLED